MKAFPKEIIVTWEEPGNDTPYLVADETREGHAIEGKKTTIAIYRRDHLEELTVNVLIKKK